MKQLTILFSLAVLLLMGSCAKEDPFSIDSGDKVIVKYTAKLPDYIDSRGIGDAECVDQLFFWVVDEQNHELSALRQRNVSFDANKTATVEVPLTPGHKYSFAFWAQDKDCEVYNPSTSFIEIDYYDEEGYPYLANDDQRDAFYALETNIEVSTEGEMVQREVTLHRPFSQLNYAISPEAFQAIKDAGVDLTNAKARVYVSEAYTKFGLLEGQPIETGDNWDEVYFEFNVMPNGVPNDKLENAKWQDDPEGEGGTWVAYDWLSFNYFLTTIPESNNFDDFSKITTWIEIETADGQTFKSQDFENVPVKGNKRTNILADFFTTDVTFNIFISEYFEEPDHNVDVTVNPIAPSQGPNPKAPLKSNIASYNGITIPTFNFLK